MYMYLSVVTAKLQGWVFIRCRLLHKTSQKWIVWVPSRFFLLLDVLPCFRRCPNHPGSSIFGDTEAFDPQLPN